MSARTAPAPAELEILRGGDALRFLADEWRDLVERCRQASIFQTWEWHVAWWRSLGIQRADCEPIFVRLRAETRTIALLPLARVDVGGRTVVRFLTAPVADYHDVIADDRAPPELLEWLARALADGLVPADGLELDELRPGALLRLALERHAGALALELQPSSRCPYVTLPARASEQPVFSAGRQYRRKARRLEALGGPLEAEHLTEASAIRPGLDDYFDMHAAQWRERLDVAGSFDDESNRRFFEALVATLGARDWLLFSRLRSGGRVIAHDFSLRHRRVLSTYRSAFARDMSPHSPGHLLLARIGEQAARLDVAEIDLLRGEYPYKYLYATGERQSLRARTVGSSLPLARSDGIVVRSWRGAPT